MKANPDPNWPRQAELAQRRLEAEPSDEKALEALVEARIQQADFERAESALQLWRSRVPSPRLSRIEGFLALQKKEAPRAMTAWKAYLEAVPKDAEIWSELAKAQTSQRLFTEALASSSKAVELDPSAAQLAQRAAVHVRLHDWKAAENDIRRASKLDAADPAVQELYPVFERIADWKKPIERLDRASAAEPEHVTHRLDRAEWLIGIGIKDAAIDDFEEAFRRAPDSLRAKLWHGILAWDRGEPSKAGPVLSMPLTAVTSEFEKELRALDSSSDRKARARFLLRHGQPVLAAEEAPEGSAVRALALLELRRYPEAGKTARSAVARYPKDAEAWLALARLELENGNLAEALTAVERSLKLEKSPGAKALREELRRRFK